MEKIVGEVGNSTVNKQINKKPKFISHERDEKTIMAERTSVIRCRSQLNGQYYHSLCEKGMLHLGPHLPILGIAWSLKSLPALQKSCPPLIIVLKLSEWTGQGTWAYRNEWMTQTHQPSSTISHVLPKRFISLNFSDSDTWGFGPFPGLMFTNMIFYFPLDNRYCHITLKSKQKEKKTAVPISRKGTAGHDAWPCASFHCSLTTFRAHTFWQRFVATYMLLCKNALCSFLGCHDLDRNVGFESHTTYPIPIARPISKNSDKHQLGQEFLNL